MKYKISISKFKVTLLLLFMTVLCGSTEVLAQNIPDEYIYFDLAAGSVVFSGGNYTGYVYVAGESKKVTATHNAANKYYIYQSSTKTGDYDKSHTGYATTADFNARQNCRVPDYPGVAYAGKPWRDYITNNSDVDAVQTNWKNAISGTDRTSTPKRICFRNNNTYNVVLDNIYTTYEEDAGQRGSGGITIGHTEGASPTLLTNCKVTLKLKGDSRVSSIFYYSGEESNTSELHLTSFDGNGSNSGSITVVSYITNFSTNNCCCIGSAVSGTTPSMNKSYRMYFDGGTVFAGMPKYNGTGVWAGASHVTHVIGSRRETGVIITGGRLTAVSNSTAAAIGGGGGYVAAGGKATVDIKGGYVYAYNHSIYAKEYNLFVPCVAIGGSSSVEEPATLTTINITGGHVFAQSKGGCAIGGGGSAKEAGGPANINISGGAYVQAQSLAGSIGGHSFPAGSSIGGGTGGTKANMNGGYAVFHIDGGTLRAGSIGGGSTLSPTGKVGYVKAYITDGDVQAQFMMAAGSSDHCVFEMSGGTLHGSDYTSTDYPLVKSDGGAVWMDDPDGVVNITGGSIEDCTAVNGGAVYTTGGSVTVKDADILRCKAKNGNGGAVAIMATGANVSLENARICNNTAQNNGGAFFLNDNATVNITNGVISDNTATSEDGGAFFGSAGSKIYLNSGSIERNSARNGGGVYLDNGAYLNYITNSESVGYIRKNSASNLGGGVYLAKGTTSKKTELDFTLNSTNLGFYENTAEVGGDDIYAYGESTTTINIPDVQDMSLGGYSIPGATLEWWEDYRNNDSRYSAGTQQGDASKIRRYRASRDADEPIWKVPKLSTTSLSDFSKKYLCLTLGFEYGKMEIRRSGLKPDENAIYEVTLSSELAAEFPRPTQRVIVYGTDDEGKTDKLWNVAKVNFLPKGTYTVKEIPWTWYNKTAYAPDKNPLTQDISTDEGKVFVFENSHHDLGETPLHDEVFKDNELSDHTSAGTDGMKLKGSWFNGVTEL